MTSLDARKPSNHRQVFKNLYFKKVQTRRIKPKYALVDKVRTTVRKSIWKRIHNQLDKQNLHNNPSLKNFATNLQDDYKMKKKLKEAFMNKNCL